MGMSSWKDMIKGVAGEVLTAGATASITGGNAKDATHYQVGRIQPIELMQDVMTPEQLKGFLRGNIMKYSLRLGHKDDELKEAEKIKAYASMLVDLLNGKTINPMDY